MSIRNEPLENEPLRKVPKTNEVSKNSPKPELSKIVKSKRSQVGDTITWIVATVIIVVVLGIFIYISSVLVTSENFSNLITNLFFGGGKQKGIYVDWIDYKTYSAFEINDANKAKIEDWIENDD